MHLTWHRRLICRVAGVRAALRYAPNPKSEFKPKTESRRHEDVIYKDIASIVFHVPNFMDIPNMALKLCDVATFFPPKFGDLEAAIVFLSTLLAPGQSHVELGLLPFSQYGNKQTHYKVSPMLPFNYR